MLKQFMCSKFNPLILLFYNNLKVQQMNMRYNCYNLLTTDMTKMALHLETSKKRKT